MSWIGIEKILRENGLLIDIYTVDAYISVFGLTHFSELEEWLTANYESFDEETKKLIIEFFIAEEKEQRLSSFCVDTARKKVGLKSVRYATVKSTMEKLGDNPAENYVMIIDCLNIFHNDTDLPNFLWGANGTEAIEKEIQAINLWLKNEEFSIKGSLILLRTVEEYEYAEMKYSGKLNYIFGDDYGRGQAIFLLNYGKLRIALISLNSDKPQIYERENNLIIALNNELIFLSSDNSGIKSHKVGLVIYEVLLRGNYIWAIGDIEIDCFSVDGNLVSRNKINGIIKDYFINGNGIEYTTEEDESFTVDTGV